ncbi:MAG: S41 family peptidase [Woeseiaceae bacterium]
MRKLVLLLIVATVNACSSDSGSSVPLSTCSVDGQKQFVVDAMREWYFWNDLLPANVDISQFATPDDVLEFLTTFSPDDGAGQPIDRFSFINSAQADQAFFGEGRFEGFGFSSRFVAADDLRLTRVFIDSPGYRAGLRRGQRILELDGRTIAEIEAAEGIGAILVLPMLEFTMRAPDNSEFTVAITKDIVTIDPVPQHRIIDAGGGRNVGYIELASFISTADSQMDSVFAQFNAAGVNEVIVDLRYNGGGLVSTANLLGDFLGGDVAENLVFSKSVFNELRAPTNNITTFLDRLGNSVSLSRLVAIASGSTASASELVVNGMEPHVEVTIVGANTFGKPVGQVGLEFCDQILRPTAFQTTNADDFGDYFDGLPVDCAAADDLDVAVGADTDPNMVAALGFLETGACPVASLPATQFKPGILREIGRPVRRGPAHREFAEAF